MGVESGGWDENRMGGRVKELILDVSRNEMQESDRIDWVVGEGEGAHGA